MEILTGLVAGEIVVIYSEDALVAGEGGKVGEVEAIGGTAEGGDVAKVVSFLPDKHAVKLTFDKKEGVVTDPEVGAEEGGVGAADGEKLFDCRLPLELE